MTKHLISGNLKNYAKTGKQFYQLAAYDLTKESNLLDYYEQLLKQLRLETKAAQVAPSFPCPFENII